MKNALKRWVIFLISWYSFFSIHAQPVVSLPTISTAKITPLENQNAPGGYCVNEFVEDNKGRLWLKTCGVAEQHYALRVVRFDGYDYSPVSLARQDWNGFMRSGLEGFSHELGLYGFLNRYPQQSTLYCYLPGKDSITYTPLENGIFAGIIEYAPGKCWVLGKHTEYLALYKWDGTTLTEEVKITKTSHYDVDKKRFYHKEACAFLQVGDQLWIYDLFLPVICYNLKTREITRYGEDAFPGIKANPLTFWEKEINEASLVYSKRQLYFQDMNRSPDFYVLPKGGSQFQSMSVLPPGGKTKRVFSDKIGNIMFLFWDSTENQKALLFDTLHQFWDFSPMIKDLPRIRTIKGENLQQKAFIGTNRGAYLYDFGEQLAIQKYLPGENIRWVAETKPGVFLVNKKAKVYWTLLDNGKLLEVNDQTCFGTTLLKTNIQQLAKSPDGHLWLNDGQTIIRFDQEAKDSCLIYDLDFIARFITFLPNGSMAVLNDQQQSLYLYNTSKREIKPIRANGKQIKFPGFVHYMMASRNGLLWVGTNDGLYKIDPVAGTLKQYGHSEDFEDYRILVLHEDRQGRIWLGTAHRGVHIFDPTKEKVINKINQDGGLANNIVVNILEDSEGDIWIGTYNGISILRPDGQLITNLNTGDGLSHYEFNRYAHYQAEDGRLVMGTLSGLNIIDPLNLKKELQQSTSSKIYITQLSYYDPKRKKQRMLQNVDDFSQPIHLKADRRNLHLKMALSNYGYSNENRYAYKLDGINKDWIYLGSQNQLNLSNLPAGRYKLLINGINHRGNWAKHPIVLQIYAQEYFYKQVWFYILCLLPFLVIAIAWVYRLRREKVVLEETVANRTQQIRKDKTLIEQQAKELQQMDQMKSSFFANISHELRTPLTLITGPTELLTQKEKIKTDNGLKKIVQTISQNSRKLLHLVEEMLDLARLESQRIQLHEAPIPLFIFCKQLFEAYQFLASHKQIDYRFDYNLEPSFTLLADPHRLEKIINNLLSNALKFTNQGDQVTMKVEKTEDNVVFLVSDTGRGIPKEDLPHIFERFFQSKESALASAGGSGIGLFLSNELAQLMNGKLQVESIWGMGSTFSLAIPVKTTPSVKSIPKWTLPTTKTVFPTTDNNLAVKTPENAPRIMIVEDNKELQEFIHQLLAPDYHTLPFDNGRQALDFLQNSSGNGLPVDLILSDIMMPQLDGYGLIEAVKKDIRLQQLPMVMLTAKNREQYKLRALRMGIDDYLTKPFSPLELKLRVQNLINNYREREAFRKSNLPISPDFGETVSADQTWLEELEKAALQALDKQIDLKEEYLADAMAVSGRQLRRKIKSLTGLTMGRYIQEIKLQKARHLLENKAMPTVAEIGYSCGFKSPSHFTQLFSSHFGKLPSEFHK